MTPYNGTNGIIVFILMFHGRNLRKHCVFALGHPIMKILMRLYQVYDKTALFVSIKLNLND